MNIDKLYSRTPVWLQNVGISTYGYKWKKRRFGGVFEEKVKEFKERENYSSQQWYDFQTVELRKILCHAFDNVPFYNQKYSESGFRKAHLEKIELKDLKDIPYLEKEELRVFGETSLMSKIKDDGEFYASSGSTGTPTKIYFSKNFHQRWSAAFESRIRHWAGVDYKEPRGMIGGRRVVAKGKASAPFYRYNFVEKQTYFSAYHISPQNAENYLNGIKKHKVSYMTGYAVSNYLLAEMMHQEGLKVPELKAVITSSEKLTPMMRETFRKVYGCNTFDSYSGVEACGLISENSFGELMISPDVGIMEILDVHGAPVENGHEGEIVSTGLLNYDQPLIRYRIGDMARLSGNQVSASNMEMPIIKEITGRVEDVIVGVDGRAMVRFHSIFIDIPYLKNSQVIQETIDTIVINLVVEKGFDKIRQESQVKKRLVSQLGEIQVLFKYLDYIPRENNGKFKAVISKIK